MIIERSVLVRESTLIQAPVKSVWDAFSRLEDWPGWGSACREARFARGRPWETESVLEIAVPRRGGRTRVRVKLLESRPPRGATWAGTRFGIYGQQVVSFEPEGDGTMATASIAFSGPTLLLLSLALPERRVRQMCAGWLRGLKEAAESARG